MPRVDQFVCDQCGHVKQESNRWWISYAESNHGPSIQFLPFGSAELKTPGLRFLCSEQCGIKELSEFMTRSSH